eukprot:TRINITY_DN26603_c0_g1_i1.p1 TRINITY_DN26603_c0_g1~~TRINITY_DN26603_c0_g1_i1.p1  ORF type:complete len:984 (+),score=125.15 TRINITY_DN26603_c0_g1_i1:79-3030(+)
MRRRLATVSDAGQGIESLSSRDLSKFLRQRGLGFSEVSRIVARAVKLRTTFSSADVAKMAEDLRRLRGCRKDHLDVAVMLAGFGTLPTGVMSVRFVEAVARHVEQTEWTATDPQSVADALAGLCARPKCPAVPKVFTALVPFVLACKSDFDGVQASECIASFRAFKDSLPVRKVLSALASVLSERAPRTLSARDLAAALHGLRFHSDGSAAEAVLQTLACRVGDLRDANCQLIGKAVGGMRGLTGPAAEHILARYADAATRVAPAESIGDVNSVIRGVHGTSIRAARSLLTTVLGWTERLPRDAPEAAAVAIGQFQGCVDTAESRALLNSLADHLSSPGKPFECTQFHMVFSALKTVPSSGAARRVLLSVADKMPSSKPVSRSLGNVLYGLRCQDDTAEVQEVLGRLEPWFVRCTEEMSPQHMANALYGLRNFGPSPPLRRILAVLTPMVARTLSSGPPGTLAVSSGLFGLQSQHPTAESAELFDMLSAALWPIVSPMPPEQVAAALFGLRGQVDSQATRRVVSFVALHMNASRAPFSPSAIGTALRGVHRLGNSASIRKLFAALVPAVLGCTGPASPRDSSSALQGVRGQHPDTTALALLGALGSMIERSRQSFPAESVAGALVGLASLGGTHESRKVIGTLATRVRGDTVATPETVGGTLYGLHRESDSIEVRALLERVVSSMEAISATAPVNPQSVAIALYGLRGQPGSPVVRRVVGALVPLVARTPLSARQWSMGLFGLQGLSSSPESVAMLKVLFHHSARIPALTEIDASQAGGGVLAMLRAVDAAGSEFQQLLRSLFNVVVTKAPASTASSGLRAVLSMGGIHSKTAPEKSLALSRVDGVSARERALRRLLLRAGVYGFEFSVMHPSGFEMDLVYRKSHNIEIDGYSITYRAEGKRRLQKVRDGILSDAGMRVTRVSTVGRQMREVVDHIAEACGAEECSEEWAEARLLADRGWDIAIRNTHGKLVADIINLDFSGR